jgi:hypothetical protein
MPQLAESIQGRATSPLLLGEIATGTLRFSKTKLAPSALAELPYGSSTFIPITWGYDEGHPNQVQWDGHYMTWETFGRKDTSILRFTVSGSAATVVGKTHLRGPQLITQSWIAGDRVIVPYASQGSATNKIGVWRYPKGGRILAKFGNFGQNANTRVLGVALSVSPSHK